MTLLLRAPYCLSSSLLASDNTAEDLAEISENTWHLDITLCPPGEIRSGTHARIYLYIHIYIYSFWTVTQHISGWGWGDNVQCMRAHRMCSENREVRYLSFLTFAFTVATLPVNCQLARVSWKEPCVALV